MGSTSEEKMKHAFDQTHTDYETFTTFSTPLPCAVCKRPTTWGHLELIDSQYMQYSLNPFCPVHGLAQRTNYLGEWEEGKDAPTDTPLEWEEKRNSIEHFVRFQHDWSGVLKEVVEVEPQLAEPEFHLWQREDFKTEEEYQWWQGAGSLVRVWAVTWSLFVWDGPTRNYFVVWDGEYSSFHLIDKQEKTCIPPQNMEYDGESEK